MLLSTISNNERSHSCSPIPFAAASGQQSQLRKSPTPQTVCPSSLTLIVTVVYFRVEVFVDTFFKVAVHGVKNVDFLTLFLQVFSLSPFYSLSHCSFLSDYSPPPPSPKRSVSPHSPAPANRVYHRPPVRPPPMLNGMPLRKFVALFNVTAPYFLISPHSHVST